MKILTKKVGEWLYGLSKIVVYTHIVLYTHIAIYLKYYYNEARCIEMIMNFVGIFGWVCDGGDNGVCFCTEEEYVLFTCEHGKEKKKNLKRKDFNWEMKWWIEVRHIPGRYCICALIMI